MRLAGDTAAVASVFAEMMQQPGEVHGRPVVRGRVQSAAASARDEDAITLFESGLKKNPYHRLALLNLSNVLFQMKDVGAYGRGRPSRLIKIDPNNPDSWRMHAGYWQLRGRAETDAAKKKAYGDSTLAAIKRRDEREPQDHVFLASKTGNTLPGSGQSEQRERQGGLVHAQVRAAR